MTIHDRPARYVVRRRTRRGRRRPRAGRLARRRRSEADLLDTGIDAGEGYRAATRFGTTAEEERQGESLDQLLAEEEPDSAADDEWTDEDNPRDDDHTTDPRSGRLVAPDEGAHGDEETDAVAVDVGIDGGGAAAEEAAVHLIDEDVDD